MGAKSTKPKIASEVTEETEVSQLQQRRRRLPIMGPESIMQRKQHGTSNACVQQNLRWGCDRKVADRICSFNVRCHRDVDTQPSYSIRY